MQGALPVVVDGEVTGGIGASFATPEEDEQVAKTGLAALSERSEVGACFERSEGDAMMRRHAEHS